MTQNEHVYAVCCRPEVAGDPLSDDNVNTIEGYALLNFEVAIQQFPGKSKSVICVMRRQRQAKLGRRKSQSAIYIVLGSKEQECLTDYQRGNEDLESEFPKLYNFSESVEPLSRNRDPNMTHNEYVYAICCRPEVDGDVISSENAKTIEGYAVLNLEIASFSSFPDIPKNNFVTAADGFAQEPQPNISLTVWLVDNGRMDGWMCKI